MPWSTATTVPPCRVDSDFLPLQIFQTARDDGTMAALEPVDRHFYEQVERQLNWLHGVWERSSEFGMGLRVLGVDGPLSETARDEMLQNLAALDTAPASRCQRPASDRPRRC
jgi:hypothetical protein